MYLYLYSYRREAARQLRMYAQLTRCSSAVAELLVYNIQRFVYDLWPTLSCRMHAAHGLTDLAHKHACILLLELTTQPIVRET